MEKEFFDIKRIVSDIFMIVNFVKLGRRGSVSNIEKLILTLQKTNF